MKDGLAVSRTELILGNRRFESISLQERVHCELDHLLGAANRRRRHERTGFSLEAVLYYGERQRDQEVLWIELPRAPKPPTTSFSIRSACVGARAQGARVRGPSGRSTATGPFHSRKLSVRAMAEPSGKQQVKRPA